MTAPQPSGGARASADGIGALIDGIFAALGFTPAERAVLAEVLLEASLAGYDSHGVMRIPTYVGDTRAGMIRPATEPVIEHETAASARIDARRCLGPVSTVRAIEAAGEKARATGIGCVGVRNGNDVARLGAYVTAPARAGLITILMVNDAGGGAAVVPWGGAAPFLSTNPLAAGIPRPGGAPPIVLDLSTSIVALGKLKMAANKGETVPESWLIGPDGRPQSDPGRFFTRPRGAGLRPLGGADGGHKGFALSLLVDVLAGALTGAGCSTGREEEDRGNGLLVLSLDPDAFGAGAGFADQVAALAAGLEAVPHAPGSAGVRLPGARPAGEQAGAPDPARMPDDIRIDAPTWARIAAILNELGLPVPAGVTPSG